MDTMKVSSLFIATTSALPLWFWDSEKVIEPATRTTDINGSVFADWSGTTHVYKGTLTISSSLGQPLAGRVLTFVDNESTGRTRLVMHHNPEAPPARVDVTCLWDSKLQRYTSVIIERDGEHILTRTGSTGDLMRLSLTKDIVGDTSEVQIPVEKTIYSKSKRNLQLELPAHLSSLQKNKNPHWDDAGYGDFEPSDYTLTFVDSDRVKYTVNAPSISIAVSLDSRIDSNEWNFVESDGVLTVP